MSDLEERGSAATDSHVSWLPTTRTILLVSLGAVIILVSVGGYLLGLETEMVESSALHDASQYSEAISEFRTLYTSEVVDRARKHGVSVRHDYQEEEAAIPLPATMSILLGNQITSETGGSVRLFSDYPFPWRAKKRQGLDAFEEMALHRLRKHPDSPVFSFEEYQGRPALRYATADRMRPSCVQCHNQHPDSPKRDWKVGDVRGVLEVIRPMHVETYEARQALRSSVWFVLVAAGLGLLGLAFFSFRLRRSTLTAERLASDSIEVNRSLERQIIHREKAERESANLQKQVLHAQKLESLGLLAGGVAHDFNNLLTVILGNAYLARKKLGGNDSAQQHVARVREASLRARDLTDQLLAYAGRASFEQEPMDLGALVSGIGEMLSTIIPPQVAVKYKIEKNLPLIIADRAQMQQVTLNLFTNACEAIGDEQGEVVVRIGALSIDGGTNDQNVMGTVLVPGPHVYLGISDTGKGMDAQTCARIFDPFYSTKGPGRGLGLSAILGIARAHDGALVVDSEPGKGTRFRLTFPVIDRPVDTVGEADIQNVVDRSIQCVLVVDDNDDVRVATAGVLEALGWNVIHADGGAEAVEVLKNQAVTVVLLDMIMPGMTGAEAFHRIRELHPGMPIVLTSGYQEDNASEDLCKLSPAAFIKKPYTLASLERVLTDVIERRSPDNAS